MAVVGSAFIQIRGDTSKLAADIASANLTPAALRLSRQLEAPFAAVADRIGADLSGALDQVPTDLQLALDIDTDPAERELRELEGAADSVDLQFPTPDLDVDPLLADIRKIEAEAERAAQRIAGIESAGAKAAKLGGLLTLGVTAPLLLAGRAAISSATDIERSLSQVIGLAGGTVDDVEAASGRLRTLAGETGKDIGDLGDALLAIFSAGFTGEAALQVLEVSGRAAAAGLGETRDVANAVTNALGAYGADVLTAAEATDVLVNTVKEGKAEASELAPQFGRLLPVASELGISFADVGAGLAFLTRSSGDASLSATQLSGIMQKLLKPSKEGAEALAAAGFASDDLRKSLRERGLLSTLVDIRGSLEATGGSLTQVFEDAEGLTGVLSLTADSGEAAATVFDNLADSTGTLDTAFDAFSGTNAAKLDRASAEFSVAMERIGAVALPVLASVLGFVGDLVGVFSGLPGPVQQAAVAALALTAAVGPLLAIGGKLAQNFQLLMRLSPTLSARLSGIETGGATGRLGQLAGAAGILATAAVVGGGIIASRLKNDAQATEDFLGGVVDSVNEAAASGDFDALDAKIGAINDGIVELGDTLSGSQNPLDGFKRRQLRDGIEGLQGIGNAAVALRDKAVQLADQLRITRDEALGLAQAGPEAVAAFQRQRGALQFDIDPIQAAASAVDALQTAFLRGEDTAQLFADAQVLTGATADELSESLEALGGRANELGDQFVQGLGGLTAAFETTFGDEIPDTLDAFFTSFQEQTAAALTFTANIEQLIARGALGLAASFSAQGLAAADLAAEAVAQTDAALAESETKFAFLQALQGTAEQRSRAFATRLTDDTAKLVDALPNQDDITRRLTEALAQGDDAFFEELDRIAQEAKQVAAASFPGVGEAIALGVGAGLVAEIDKVKAAAQRVVDETLGVFDLGFDFGSPSKVTRRMGVLVAQGLAVGIEQELGRTDLGLDAFLRQLPDAGTVAAFQGVRAPVGIPSPAQPPSSQPGQVAAGGVTFGDIIVPVPPGATPAEQAAAVGKYVAWAVTGATA